MRLQLFGILLAAVASLPTGANAQDPSEAVRRILEQIQEDMDEIDRLLMESAKSGKAGSGAEEAAKKKAAEEEARRKAAEEAAKKKAEEEARRKAELEAKKKAAEAAAAAAKAAQVGDEEEKMDTSRPEAEKKADSQGDKQEA